MNLLALFQSYKLALVRVTVQTPAGDLSTGTAFHIGDGWLVTAAHVLKDGVLQELISEYLSAPLRVESVIFNKDDRIDLALVKTDLNLSHYLHNTTIRGAPDGFVQTDHVEIGGHLDDWLGDELVLSKVLLMGIRQYRSLCVPCCWLRRERLTLLWTSTVGRILISSFPVPPRAVLAVGLC